VDTPDRSELIAANHNLEEIRQFTEADSLAYLSLKGLREAVGDSQGECCYSCYTGSYPTDIVGIEQLVTDHRQKDVAVPQPGD
jgi:amidophosphoribosyltransferase